jgi:hypothetical protein
MAVPMIPPTHAPAFLAAHGWGGAQILPLAGDASFRRYFRVVDGARQAVLMDAPPPHEDPRPFIAVAEYLCALGLNAPTILARDLEQGLLLIEDFGDVRLRETVDEQLHKGERLLCRGDRPARSPSRAPGDGRTAGARARPMAQRGDAVHRLVLPRTGYRGRPWRIPCGMGSGAGAHRGGRPAARHRAA